MKTRLHIDIETFSECDLTKEGVHRYARHPSTEILIVKYSIDDEEEIRGFSPHLGEPTPKDFTDAYTDPEVLNVAFNAPFEKNVIEHVLGLESSYDQWLDTMVMAKMCGLPASLKGVSKVIGMTQKQDIGKKLIKKFSMPRKPTKADPRSRIRATDLDEDLADFRLFEEYCADDVRAERDVFLALRKYTQPIIEWERWRRNEEMNDRGVPLDIELASKCRTLYDRAKEEKLAELQKLMGVENPNSPKQILGWVSEKPYLHGDPEHYSHDNLQKANIEKALKSSSIDPDIRTVLEGRIFCSATSASKFAAADRTRVGDVIPGCLNFYGAVTSGRWSARNFQIHNFPRPDHELNKNIDTLVADVLTKPYEYLSGKYDISEATKTLVRPMICAPEGKIFIDCDLGSIENRVLGWVAGCTNILDVFHDKKDPYKDFATKMFEVPYESVTKKQRTESKPAVLGCGYGLGGGGINDKGEKTGLYGYADGMGIKLSLPEAKESVEKWRAAYPEVPEFWQLCTDALREVIEGKNEVKIGDHITMRINRPFLEIQLPSRRKLRYLEPKMVNAIAPWSKLAGKGCRIFWDKHKKCRVIKKKVLDHWEEVPYSDEDIHYTASYLKPGGAGVIRTTTYGGKITENICQAIARDILAVGIDSALDAGLDVRFHIHDQILAVVDEGEAEEKLKLLEKCMIENPPWALDLPLAADGFISKRFSKD